MREQMKKLMIITLSLVSVSLSMSLSASEILEIDLTDLDGEAPAINDKPNTTDFVQPLVQKSLKKSASDNGRYHQSSRISSSVYSSQGTVIGQRRNVELVAPNRPSLVLSTPAALSDIAREVEVTEPDDDESMLSFIDTWLGIDPVKPWQKGTLAEKSMKPGGVVPEFDRFSEKVFSYKQGSVGGSGVGGGGCGCN